MNWLLITNIKGLHLIKSCMHHVDRSLSLESVYLKFNASDYSRPIKITIITFHLDTNKTTFKILNLSQKLSQWPAINISAFIQKFSYFFMIYRKYFTQKSCIQDASPLIHPYSEPQHSNDLS